LQGHDDGAGQDQGDRRDPRPGQGEGRLHPLLDQAAPMRLKAILLGFAVVAAAIALAACGGGGSSSGGGTSAGGAPTAAAGNGADAASAPEIEDWPLFGRDRDNTRFATQDEIDTGNVDELGEAWST